MLELVGYKLPPATDSGAKQLRQREAVVQLDQWDGPNFERARAALDRNFPEQSSFMFSNLVAKTGADSIGTVRTFLDPARDAARRDRPRARQYARAGQRHAWSQLAEKKV